MHAPAHAQSVACLHLPPTIHPGTPALACIRNRSAMVSAGVASSMPLSSRTRKKRGKRRESPRWLSTFPKAACIGRGWAGVVRGRQGVRCRGGKEGAFSLDGDKRAFSIQGRASPPAPPCQPPSSRLLVFSLALCTGERVSSAPRTSHTWQGSSQMGGASPIHVERESGVCGVSCGLGCVVGSV